MVTGVPGSIMTANIMGATVPAHKDVVQSPPAPPAIVKSDRRSNKPIMEKRRRARINNCLNELKTLILDATKKDPARHSKLEKADILEKTVKHLQELQRQQAALQQAADPKIINKFKAGFTDCANEVSRFPGLEPAVKRRLLQHLSNCINGVKTELHHHQRQMAAAQAQQLHAQMLPSPPSSPEQDQHMMQQHHQQQQQQQQLQQQQQQQQLQQQQQQQQQQHMIAANTVTATAAPTTPAGTAIPYMLGATTQIQATANGCYILPNGLQVIPTKLPNGNIALILPQHQLQQQTHPAGAGAGAAPVHHQQFHHQHQMAHHHHHHQQQSHHHIMSIPSRTSSTGSASSQSSSNYDHAIASPIANGTSNSNSMHYSPPSPANSYEAMMDTKTSVIQHAAAAFVHQQQQQQQQQNQQPLSLVVKKNIIKEEEEQPWRPW